MAKDNKMVTKLSALSKSQAEKEREARKKAMAEALKKRQRFQTKN